MKVKKVIVHSIIKKTGESKAISDLSLNVLGIDDRVIELVSKVNQSYRKLGITYAVFNEDDEFPKLIINYLNTNEEHLFVDFTRKATEILKKRIENIPAAKGGFLLFAEYIHNDDEYFSIYLIRDTLGILFTKDTATSSYRINPAEYIDQDRLAMACRINIKNYKVREGKYLSVIKRRMNDISDYFINWIAASEQESNRSLSRDFLTLINQADSPLDEGGKEIARDTFKKNVYDYVYSLPTDVININDVSKHFYDDENYLYGVAEANNIYLNTEFTPTKAVLKKLLRIDLESDGISIRFSRKDFHNNKIHFDNQNQNVVIIESEKFASDLRQEINSDEST